MKRLFDFPFGDIGYEDEPTCVVSEQTGKQLQSAVAPVETTSRMSTTSTFDWWKTPVYLTSQQGFDHYCKGCEKLAKFEKTTSTLFTIRVFCSIPKCLK